MKKLIILFLIMLVASQSKAQNIIDFFYSIPSNYVDDLSYLERKELIENKTLTKDDLLYSIDYDRQNGYLRMEQSYTEGQSGFGIYEITYWNLDNKKLIAVSSVMGSNGGTHQNDFKFFTYENQILTEARTGYLLDYTSNFDVFINNLISDFTKIGTKQEIKEDLKYFGFTIELPKKGKDIKVSFNPLIQEYFKAIFSNSLKYTERVYHFNEETEIFE